MDSHHPFSAFAYHRSIGFSGLGAHTLDLEFRSLRCPFCLPPFGHPPSPPPAQIQTMSDPQEQPWSNNPDAPKIPYYLYDTEKATLAGSFLSSILYGMPETHPPTFRLSAFTSFVRVVLGMLVVLCFKCISALLNPIHHKGEGVKRGLVSCTVATFSFATVYTAISLDTQSVAFIDNREFTDPNGALLGPLGYRAAIDFAVLGVIPYLMFILNNLLADGLLVGLLFDVAPSPSGV